MKNLTRKRADWMITFKTEIEDARTNDHSDCKGNCRNGATCYNQSAGGYGWIANALRVAGIDPNSQNYWSGSAPTPSTSINKGIASYLHNHMPASLIN